MSNRKTTAEKIEVARLEKAQADARIKKLLKEQRKTDRKARDNRIYKRGGLIESLLPDTINLTDEQFHSFMHMTIANKFGKDKLEQIIAEGEKKAATQKPAQEEAAAKPPQPSKANETGDGDKTQTVA